MTVSRVSISKSPETISKGQGRLASNQAKINADSDHEVLKPGLSSQVCGLTETIGSQTVNL
jgi:hypothetical protein